MPRNIVIYHDEGVGPFGLSCLRQFFRDETVHLADAAAVLDGTLFETADLFVMPGGADLPYCRKLNGTGNRNIRHFVGQGGTYLGICAGAYYACRDIEYHKGRPDEICGSRELSFIEATAYGSLPDLAPWFNDALNSAAITTVEGRQVFYNGGCAFHVDDTEAEILGRFDEIKGCPPAILAKPVGKGRVILSGVHVEIDRQALENWAVETDEEEARQRLLASFDNGTSDMWKRFLQLTDGHS